MLNTGTPRDRNPRKRGGEARPMDWATFSHPGWSRDVCSGAHAQNTTEDNYPSLFSSNAAMPPKYMVLMCFNKPSPAERGAGVVRFSISAEPELFPNSGNSLVFFHVAMDRSTIFHGKTHYK